MTKATIGVIGSASRQGEEFPPSLAALAYDVGRAVAEAGAALVSGGTGGVMEAASHGARDHGGLTVGFLPQSDTSHANPYLDLAFPTGMGTMRNLLTARCCQALVMISGGVGTLNELTVAYDVGTPVVALTGSGGFADRIHDILIDDRWLDDRRVVRMSFAPDPSSAVREALARADEPRATGRLSAFIGAAGQ